jgi:WD40 repeat protein
MYISPSDPSSSFSFHKTHLLCAPVTCCSQENFLYGTDETGKILVWKIERLREKKSIECAFIYPLYKIEGHHFLVTSIGLSMDDTILVTGDVSGKIHFRSVFNS